MHRTAPDPTRRPNVVRLNGPGRLLPLATMDSLSEPGGGQCLGACSMRPVLKLARSHAAKVCPRASIGCPCRARAVQRSLPAGTAYGAVNCPLVITIVPLTGPTGLARFAATATSPESDTPSIEPTPFAILNAPWSFTLSTIGNIIAS